MQQNSINLLYLKTISIGVLFVALVVFVATFNFNRVIGNTSMVTSPRHILQAASMVRLPMRLSIPIISVDAQIESVGLTSEGAMDAPEGPDDVGLFSMGVSPGEVGTAVIDGHSGWKDGTRAVFDDLDELKIGDKIYVENEANELVTFLVKEIRTYDMDADVPVVFDSSDGLSHLNLITCAGVWDTTEKSHTKRLVVFTDRE